eukprot:TRINITY_DN3390_c0_g1_i1.p1 TRINITY_DN3390_c0_g1~~TRINITY_DN3390_c0_g1_i1.p1  ORF type:complete len:161 (-),score=19.15 TRINITY_DN3390_c0_g1_i1:355-837(-)
MRCVGVKVNRQTCTIMDPCDDCNIKAMSKKANKEIDLETCSWKKIPDKCIYNENIVCDNSLELNCGLFPTICPSNWNIKCVMDPCLCRPFWYNMDVRNIKESCAIALEPPCIPDDECPQLPCLEMTEEEKSSRLPEKRENLICVQKKMHLHTILSVNSHT